MKPVLIAELRLAILHFGSDVLTLDSVSTSSNSATGTTIVDQTIIRTNTSLCALRSPNTVTAQSSSSNVPMENASTPRWLVIGLISAEMRLTKLDASRPVEAPVRPMATTVDVNSSAPIWREEGTSVPAEKDSSQIQTIRRTVLISTSARAITPAPRCVSTPRDPTFADATTTTRTTSLLER